MPATIMFKNHIKIALRNLKKNSTMSVINIVGLSLSVAFCLLLFFYIRKEQSYDTFFAKKDRLFRFERTNTFPSLKQKPKDGIFSFLTKNDETYNEVVTPLTVGVDIKQHFPEVKSVTRFQDQSERLVKVNNTVYQEKHVLVADDNFFSNFSFKIKKGNTKSLLSSPTNAVISETIAKKYFGNADPIGKVIAVMFDSTRLFNVSGVVEDAPGNSSIQYDIVLPLVSDPDYFENLKSHFNQSSHVLIIELNEGVQMAAFENKLNQWSKNYFVDSYIEDFGKYLKDVDFANYRWYLRPLAACHYNVSNPWGHYTDAKNIYELCCLVIIILLIASLNYVLLVISNAASRSQEVGVRKVLGANRRSIVFQFWMETQIVVIAAVVIGLGLAMTLFPVFNKMIGGNLHLSDFSWRGILPACLLMCIGLGILAGYYPALILSNMKPVSILKGFSILKINPRLSSVLVVLQFTACVVLMLSAFIINRQMHFISNKNLGFDKSQVLMVTNPGYDMVFTKNARSRFRDFAKTQPYILQYSGINGGLNGVSSENGFRINGEQKWRKVLNVDYDFFEMLDIPFVAGRPFSRAFPTDTLKKKHPAIVNETLFNMLGKTAKVGEFCEPINATIIGVVKNYHFASLSKSIEPEEHDFANSYIWNFMFKIKPGEMPQAISKIQAEWKSITDYPFAYSFLDESISKMYDVEMRWQQTISASCFFAIFIACMGLFGLSAINAYNRIKEIGIRKVLGADLKDIVFTLSSRFLVMVAIAVLIATPLAWWLMSSWLEDFAYRIQIRWWMFAAVDAMALLIALITVSFLAIRAGVANPVASLRAE